MQNKVITILGATATGKTARSIALAKEISGEIISADSRQVYRGLNIGSGKVTAEEMEGIPHHLIDVEDPKNVFSANQFVTLGRRVISDILNRNKVPVIVGGTGFYIDALLGTVSLPEVEPDPSFRSQVSGFSVEKLNAMLQELDPERAKTIDQKNPVRLIRAIEIARALGKVPPPTTEASLYDTLYIGLELPDEELKEKIHTRLISRLQNGMLKEVETLHAEGLSWERMDELGLEYRFLARHLRGDMSYEEMIPVLQKEIEHYAKRQTTWFKRNKHIHWLKPNDTEGALALVNQFLKN